MKTTAFWPESTPRFTEASVPGYVPVGTGGVATSALRSNLDPAFANCAQPVSLPATAPVFLLQPLLHSLNIGTLAAWLSVAGFGAVGVLVPGSGGGEVPTRAVVMESVWVDPEVSLGEPGEAAAAGEASSEPAQTLAAPPALPELAEHSPLPEVPELPAPAPAPVVAAPAVATPAPAPRREKPAVTSTERGSGPRATGASSGAGARSGSSSASGVPGGSASGMSDASRLASGRMPSPSYPSESRRKGQTGTVVVEFTVDAAGKVISAYAKNPSPWPLLNDEAVRTVRRWKFPPGGLMKLQRPIVFRLN